MRLCVNVYTHVHRISQSSRFSLHLMARFCAASAESAAAAAAAAALWAAFAACWAPNSIPQHGTGWHRMAPDGTDDTGCKMVQVAQHPNFAPRISTHLRNLNQYSMPLCWMMQNDAKMTQHDIKCTCQRSHVSAQPAAACASASRSARRDSLLPRSVRLPSAFTEMASCFLHGQMFHPRHTHTPSHSVGIPLDRSKTMSLTKKYIQQKKTCLGVNRPRKQN